MSEASTKFVIDFVQQFGNLLQDTILKKNSADASISPIDTAISPISIFLCSLLAYPGMSGNTKKQFDDLFFELSSKVYSNGEISKTFLSDNLETGSLFTIIEDIRKSLNIEKNHENKSEIKLSNTSYITDAEQPLKSFTDSSEKLGSIQRIDFNDTSKACDIINSQIEKDTNSNIKDLIKKELLEDAVFVLVNALFFDAKWKYEFKPTCYTGIYNIMKFHKSNGEVVNMFPMKYTANIFSKPFHAHEDNFAKVISIPFQNNNYQMMIVVPKDGVDIRNIQTNSYLNMDLEERYCDITMPTWSQRTNIKLNNIFEQIGMKDMFSKEEADFSNIFPDLKVHVSELVHETLVKVDTEGVRAASATQMTCIKESYSPDQKKTFKITADRTFAWYIYDSKKLILFQGLYDGFVENTEALEEDINSLLEKDNKWSKIIVDEFIKEKGKPTKCYGRKKIAGVNSVWSIVVDNDPSKEKKIYCLYCSDSGCSKKKYCTMYSDTLKKYFDDANNKDSENSEKKEDSEDEFGLKACTFEDDDTYGEYAPKVGCSCEVCNG